MPKIIPAKRTILIITTFLFAYLSILPYLRISRAFHCTGAAAIQTEIGDLCKDPQGIVIDILFILLGVAGGTALLLMMLGGGMYVFSSGNPEKVEEAKKIITAAVSGVLLIFFSLFLLKFVGIDILGIPGLSSPGGGFIQTP